MSQTENRVFHQSDRPEVALITNHGYAGAEISIGGAPDTGGQIVYVNALAKALDTLGYRVTIFARGGFPHFESDAIRREPEFITKHVRYVFVPGGGDTFIRKEDIAVALDEEVDWLDDFVRKEAAARNRPPWELYHFVNTHYWDAAVIGVQLVERWRNDVVAEALIDLLTGSVPPTALNLAREERHWRALGEAPAYHLGALLIESEGSPATPLIQRVQAAATMWATTSRHARGAESATIVATVKKALTNAENPKPRTNGASHVGTAPALHTIIAAEALGAAILKSCPEFAKQLKQKLEAVDRHVWTPHSLGVLKQENFRDRPHEVRRNLKFCERRSHEQSVCDRTLAFAATSTEIAERLRTHYRVPGERIFFSPPCVDKTVFRKYANDELAATYCYLADVSGVTVEKLQAGRIVFETSRMDQTKRKDLVLDAFAHVARETKNVYLFIGGGPENELFKSLTAQRDANPELQGRAFITGFIPEEHIGPLFWIADVYASASEMEGFGMSVSQAAAAGAAVVSSDLIPFTAHYVPDDAIIVPAGDTEGFAGALLRLLKDDADRDKRAAGLVEKVKFLDWGAQTSAFITFLRQRGIAQEPPALTDRCCNTPKKGRTDDRRQTGHHGLSPCRRCESP